MDYTTNVFLLDLMRRFRWNEKCGVLSSNELKSAAKGQENFTFICNMSRTGEKGTHWIAIIRRGSVIWKIDSLCLDFEINPDISSFIKSKNAVVKTLPNSIQSPNSYYCGLFALFFCLYFNKNVMGSNPKLINFINGPSDQNDCICLENLSAMFDTSL